MRGKPERYEEQKRTAVECSIKVTTEGLCCCQVASVVSDSVRPHRRQLTRLPRPWDSPGKNTGVGCHFLLQRMKVKSESEVAQSCPTLRDPMDCSLPGSSVHGIFQARALEWGAIGDSISLASEKQRWKENSFSIPLTKANFWKIAELDDFVNGT